MQPTVKALKTVKDFHFLVSIFKIYKNRLLLQSARVTAAHSQLFICIVINNLLLYFYVEDSQHFKGKW